MFNEILKKFLNLQNLSAQEEIVLIKEIKTIIFFVFKYLPSSNMTEIYSKESLIEEFINDIIIKLIEKREIILTKIETSQSVKAYTKLIIANYAKDKLKKKSIQVTALQNEEIKYKSSLIKQTVKMEAMEFIKISKESLTNKEKEAICLELIDTKQKGYAIEKAKSRAKNRLKTIAQTNEFSFDAVNFALNRLFLSEICQKFVSIKEGV